jgi:hypothetical protein
VKQIEQNIESGYKEIKDLTEKVKEKAMHIYNFPTEVEIKEAKLLLSLYDRYYVVSIKYNIDGVDYEDKRPVYAELKETVYDMLFRIKDFYERTHKFE